MLGAPRCAAGKEGRRAYKVGVPARCRAVASGGGRLLLKGSPAVSRRHRRAWKGPTAAPLCAAAGGSAEGWVLAAREMLADGSPCRGVLAPGVPRCPPRVRAASPGQRRRSGSPALHNVPAGSRAAAAGSVRGGGLVPGSASCASATKPPGVAAAARRPDPALSRAALGACRPRAVGFNGSGPGQGLRLSQPALSVTFCRCFLGAAGPDRIIVPGNVALCNHKICWQPSWEEGANYAIL